MALVYFRVLITKLYQTLAIGDVVVFSPSIPNISTRTHRVSSRDKLMFTSVYIQYILGRRYSCHDACMREKQIFNRTRHQRKIAGGRYRDTWELLPVSGCHRSLVTNVLESDIHEAHTPHNAISNTIFVLLFELIKFSSHIFYVTSSAFSTDFQFQMHQLFSTYFRLCIDLGLYSRA